MRPFTEWGSTISPRDFISANAQEGVGTDWPIRYKDIAPWYDYTESFAGISGLKEGLEQLPDGKFLPAIEFNCVEKKVRETMFAKFPGRVLSAGRVANLTQEHNGRTKCQFRNFAQRLSLWVSLVSNPLLQR